MGVHRRSGGFGIAAGDRNYVAVRNGVKRNLLHVLAH